jgi:hypothetical protein
LKSKFLRVSVQILARCTARLKMSHDTIPMRKVTIKAVFPFHLVINLTVYVSTCYVLRAKARNTAASTVSKNPSFFC